MTDVQFLHAINQMRSAQQDVAQQKSSFSARSKARMYENKVDKELKRRLENL